MDERTCPVCREPFGTRGIRQHIIDFHLVFNSQDTWNCGDCVFESYNFDEIADHVLKTDHEAGRVHRQDFERKLISVLIQIQEALPTRGPEKGGKLPARPPSETVTYNSITTKLSHGDGQEMSNQVSGTFPSSAASTYPPNNDDNANDFLEGDPEKRWVMLAGQIFPQLERMDNQSSSRLASQKDSADSEQKALIDNRCEQDFEGSAPPRLCIATEGNYHQQYFGGNDTNNIQKTIQDIPKGSDASEPQRMSTSISTVDTNLIDDSWIKKEKEEEEEGNYAPNDIPILSQIQPRKEQKQIKSEDEETREETKGTIGDQNRSFKEDHQYFYKQPETGKEQHNSSMNIVAKASDHRIKNITDAVQHQILCQHNQKHQQQLEGEQNHQQKSFSSQNAANPSSIFEQLLRQQIVKTDPKSFHGDSSTTTTVYDVRSKPLLLALPNSGDASSSSSYPLSSTGRLLMEKGSKFQPREQSPPRPTNTEPPPKKKDTRTPFTIVEKMRMLAVYDALKSQTAAARLAEINPENLHKWIRNRATIEGFSHRHGAENDKRKRVRGRKAQFPNLEERLSGWIQSEDRMVRQYEVRSKALEIFDSLGGPLEQFSASNGWFQSFIKRRSLQAYVYRPILTKSNGPGVTGTDDHRNNEDDEENDDGDFIEDDAVYTEDQADREHQNDQYNYPRPSSISSSGGSAAVAKKKNGSRKRRHHAEDGGNLPADLQQRLEAELDRRKRLTELAAFNNNPMSLAAAAASSPSSYRGTASSSSNRSTATANNLPPPSLLLQQASPKPPPLVLQPSTISHYLPNIDINNRRQQSSSRNDHLQQSNSDGAAMLDDGIIARQSKQGSSNGVRIEPGETSFQKMNIVNVNSADVKASAETMKTTTTTTASVSANICNIKPLEFNFEFDGSGFVVAGARGGGIDEKRPKLCD